MIAIELTEAEFVVWAIVIVVGVAFVWSQVADLIAMRRETLRRRRPTSTKVPRSHVRKVQKPQRPYDRELDDIERLPWGDPFVMDVHQSLRDDLPPPAA